MRRDLSLFTALEAGEIGTTLRLYSWQPKCLTLGYSQKIEREIDLPLAQKLGWDAVVRPTGGGIVFHNEAEITYSLVIRQDDPVLPRGLIPAYKKISEAVAAGLNLLGMPAEVSNVRRKTPNASLCFAYPAEYEVVVNGRKVVGSAQKRGQTGLLQQGSVFVRSVLPADYVVLKRKPSELSAISLEELGGRQFSFAELCEALIIGFRGIMA